MKADLKYFTIASPVDERIEQRLQQLQLCYQLLFTRGRGWEILVPSGYFSVRNNGKGGVVDTVTELSKTIGVRVRKGTGYPSMHPLKSCLVAMELKTFFGNYPIMLVDYERDDIIEITDDTIVTIPLIY